MSQPNYTPSSEDSRFLKRIGLSKGEILDLARAYSAGNCSFRTFAIWRHKERLSHVTKPAKGWLPSSEAKNKLLLAGIPSSLINEFTERYKELRQNTSVSFADLNADYESWCLSEWSEDCRNQKAPYGTLMRSGWQPGATTIKELIDKGIQKSEIEIEASVFALYWTERKEKKADWNTSFYWWACRKYKKV